MRQRRWRWGQGGERKERVDEDRMEKECVCVCVTYTHIHPHRVSEDSMAKAGRQDGDKSASLCARLTGVMQCVQLPLHSAQRKLSERKTPSEGAPV